MPIASTSPNRLREFRLKSSASIAANVPTSDTGIAAAGISVARQLPRNTNTTSTTSPTAM